MESKSLSNTYTFLIAQFLNFMSRWKDGKAYASNESVGGILLLWLNMLTLRLTGVAAMGSERGVSTGLRRPDPHRPPR